MNIREIRLGTKLELEIINTMGDKVGKTYISQLLEIVDNENILVAAPILESRVLLAPNGTKVRAMFLHDKFGILSFDGTVSGKEKRDSIVCFQVKISGSLQKIQRRKYYRLDCLLNTEYRVITEEEQIERQTPSAPKRLIVPKYNKAVTKNLSGSGACLAIEENIPLGSLVEAIIYLPPNQSIKIVCKVMRSSAMENSRNKKYELGLYFSEISQKDQNILVKYIFDQQRAMLKNNLDR